MSKKKKAPEPETEYATDEQNAEYQKLTGGKGFIYGCLKSEMEQILKHYRRKNNAALN